MYMFLNVIDYNFNNNDNNDDDDDCSSGNSSIIHDDCMPFNF